MRRLRPELSGGWSLNGDTARDREAEKSTVSQFVNIQCGGGEFVCVGLSCVSVCLAAIVFRRHDHRTPPSSERDVADNVVLCAERGAFCER